MLLLFVFAANADDERKLRGRSLSEWLEMLKSDEKTERRQTALIALRFSTSGIREWSEESARRRAAMRRPMYAVRRYCSWASSATLGAKRWTIWRQCCADSEVSVREAAAAALAKVGASKPAVVVAVLAGAPAR